MSRANIRVWFVIVAYHTTIFLGIGCGSSSDQIPAGKAKSEGQESSFHRNTTVEDATIESSRLVAASPSRLAAANELERLLDKNLRMHSSAELRPLLNLIGKQTAIDPTDASDLLKEALGLNPWYVWKSTAPKFERFIVFEGQPLFMIPGSSGAAIHLLNVSGEKLGRWEFITGWRIDLEEASMTYSDDLKSPLIVIKSAPEINGRNVAKQFFAFAGDQLRFVRMEDDEGRLLQNNYKAPNHTLGIAPEAKTVDQWIEMLAKERIVNVLAALTYLGGIHRHPSQSEGKVLQEDIEQAQMTADVRRDQRIQKLIDQHLCADQIWIQEAAEFAARELPNR